MSGSIRFLSWTKGSADRYTNLSRFIYVSTLFSFRTWCIHLANLVAEGDHATVGDYRSLGPWNHWRLLPECSGKFYWVDYKSRHVLTIYIAGVEES